MLYFPVIKMLPAHDRYGPTLSDAMQLLHRWEIKTVLKFGTWMASIVKQKDTDCANASDCNVTAQCAAASSPFGNTVTKCLGHQEVATGCGSPEALGQDGQPANANEHGELNSCLVRHHLDNVEVAAGSNTTDIDWMVGSMYRRLGSRAIHLQ
jgi:hypothetical protein